VYGYGLGSRSAFDMEASQRYWNESVAAECPITMRET
jgi:hypothetical protein